MILQSLVKYYEILAEDEDSGIPKLGYSMVNVSFALNISKEGELISVIPLKIREPRGKKLVEVPQSMDVPEQEKKAVGIKSNFLCENSSYMLGNDNKEKPQRAKECFEAFKELHIKLLNDIDCDEARAVIYFVSKWNVEKGYEHPALLESIEEMKAGVNIIFMLDGSNYIHQNSKIKRAWENYKLNCVSSNLMQCLVSGEKEPISRLHPNIKRVKGAQAVGASIVSFNARAYESYGKDDKQGLNSPISEYATFAYTTVLNHLLSDNAHRQYFGDATVVFWAQSPKNTYKDLFSLLINPNELEATNAEDTKFIRDNKAINEVKGIFKKISSGSPIGDFSDAFDPKTEFCILGLSPNAARLSVRFFLKDTFGGFVKKISKHYEDLTIEKQYENEPDYISVWRILNETVSPKSNDKSASPLLAGAVLRSIISGFPYPNLLFNSIMLRIKAEQNITYYKASIIKAFLLRNLKNKFKEVLTVSLNEQSDNKAYILGRLFAVLEKAQEDASEGNLNSTIKDRYFSSACSTPASVFPILLRLSFHHTSKAEYGYVSEKRKSEILEKLDIVNNPIPSHLSLEEQGLFVLGYYHQRNAFFKNNNKEEN